MADFATVAELETFMGTTGLGARGTAMLGYASALIRRYTGQDIEQTLGRQEEFAANATRRTIELRQVPVTAVAVTVDAVAFTDFEWDRATGQLVQVDGGPWDEGPIIVTYDSGYDPASDEATAVKLIALEVASRALAPNAAAFESFATEVGEVRSGPVGVYLAPAEQRELDGLGRVVVLA